jgi:hypothetical protein
MDVLRDIPRLALSQLRDWDALVPQGDCAVVYDLLQHQHTAIGDPLPCGDEMHVGQPSIAGTQAGIASREYEALFRLVEQAGYQACAIDMLERPADLNRHRLVFVPGSPLLSRRANQSLTEYAQAGGTVVVCGVWPTLDDCGRPLAFLGLQAPVLSGDARWPVGAGQVRWTPQLMGTADAEKDSIEHIRWVESVLDQTVPAAHVRIAPRAEVSWVDWKEGGGTGTHQQPRNLGSAILHRSQHSAYLFVLNHYMDAVEFQVTLADRSFTALRHVQSGEVTPLVNGSAVVDIDRKAGTVYELVRGKLA